MSAIIGIAKFLFVLWLLTVFVVGVAWLCVKIGHALANDWRATSKLGKRAGFVLLSVLLAGWTADIVGAIFG